MPVARLSVLVILLLAGLALGGCGEPPSPASRDDASLRIVSLSPALSRTLVDLGLEDAIVGRSRFCDFLDPAIPVAGDLLTADYERLVELAPTHVLIQEETSGIDPRLAELARRQGWRIVAWRGLDTIDDIERVIRELPSMICAPDTPRLETLTRRAATLTNDLAAALRPAAAGSWVGPTLIVYQASPVGVFGRGTYLSDVLSRLGAENAIERRGWTELTLEDVTRLDPPAIILVRPARRPDEPTDAAAALGVLATLEIDAVRAGRVAVLSHPDALLPSTGIIAVAREMRAVLRELAVHPTPAPVPEPAP